jgi:phospholipid/cholesterol/gamma-HCH transport system substrate-binding protein
MKITGPAIRLAAFLVAAAITAVFLDLVLSGSRGGTEVRGYHAVFADSSFLKEGDEVRIAGVPVGQVTGLHHQGDNSILADFQVPGNRPLTESVRAAIRYKNLLGDRYLELRREPGPLAALPPGATIPRTQTSPALDLDVLVGGFKPLFQALDPEQINKLSVNVLAALQGEGDSVNTLLASVSSLTGTLADREQVIGEVITNLNTAIGTLDAHDSQLSDLISQLQQLVTGLSSNRETVTDAIAHVNGLADDASDLLEQLRPDLRTTLERVNTISTTLNQNSQIVNDSLRDLGPGYDRVSDIGIFGSFVDMYLCDLRIKATGPNGQPLYTPWISSEVPRCSGKPTGQ